MSEALVTAPANLKALHYLIMEDHAYAEPQKEISLTKKRKRELKMQRDRRIQKTRVNIGVAFPRWKELLEEKDFTRDAEVACFLLDIYEAYRQTSSVSNPVKRCDHPAHSISSIEVKSESCPVHIDDSMCTGKQETHANAPMTGDTHLRGASEITMTTNVSYEEGCTGITFDISEIFAPDGDGDCLNQETGGEDEEENEETHSREEFDDSDPEWDSDALSGSELSDSDQLEKDELNEVHRKARELCPECGKFFYVGKTHTCEYKIKPFACNICGKRCKDNAALKSHSRIHEEDYQHFCKFCLAPFKTRHDKLGHQVTHILNEKPYECPDCTMTFSKLRARNFHLKEHRGPNRVSCPHCSLVFLRANRMKRHIVVHTGVKQFVCKSCSRSFNQPGHLKSHMRLHTGEKPYRCQHCDKSFNHNVSLKSHVMRYHKGASEENNEKRTSNGDTDATGVNVTDQDPKLKEPTKGIKKMWDRSMGRPVGRPKRKAARGDTNSNPAVQGKALDSTTAAEPADEGHLKRASSRCIESDGSDSEAIWEPAEEESLKESRGVRKSKRKASQRLRTFEIAEEGFDSDSDFDPAEDEVKRKRQTGCEKVSKHRTKRKDEL